MSGDRNIQVYFRIFPMKNTEWGLVKIEDSTMYIQSTQGLANNIKGQIKYWEFISNGIFSNVTQESVYSHVMNDVLDRIISGYNGIIIGFGQTGTGKSFTLGGLQYTELEFGIAPRVILDLFRVKKELPSNMKMNIHMSYTEFSKRCVIDLFKNYPNSIDAWHVKNATRIHVKSEHEALKWLYKGEGRKTFANNNTYFSHINSSVLTFHIVTANFDFSCPEKNSSRLHIIDLAGVDSVGNISSDFKSPLDIGKANTLKFYLEQFILNLMENVPERIHVKERTNPLIYFLGSDLSSESILRFIGHIKIQKEYLKITLSTLRFSQLIRGLHPKSKMIEPEINENVKLQHLKHKLDCLQKEKVYNSVLLNQDLTRDINDHRIEHIRGTVDAYIHNRITELNILNVAEATEVLRVFKSMYSNVVEEEKVRIQDSDMPKFKRNSKGGSKNSIKMNKSLAKKGKKSKESLTTVEKPKHQSSNVSLQKKRSVSDHSTSQMSSKTGSPSQSNIKKMRSNASLAKAGSISATRKLTGSYIRDKKDHKAYLTDTALIPDILPKYRKAWNTFINDVKSSFKILHESYKANESELKRVYIDYQKNIQKLEMLREILETGQNELLEAKMFKQYISLCKPDKHESKSVDPEKLCQEHLNKAQMEMLVQKEIVLKLQSEMKICLNNRRNIKQNLRDDFDQYSKDNYRITTTGLDEADEEFLLEDTLSMEFGKEEDVEEEQHKCIQKPAHFVRIDVLKTLMQKELRKTMKLKELKNRRWNRK